MLGFIAFSNSEPDYFNPLQKKITKKPWMTQQLPSIWNQLLLKL